jgi:hypothetical protein
MARKISDNFWGFSVGLIIGVPLGLFSGVLLVSALVLGAFELPASGTLN